ncbi:MAG: GIY-YIG nuclease family protein [Methanobacteriaceae archaeon]|nr:GIY-YIG nuclease family protein [Methanobacteriaceae archaeon]
MYGYVYKIENIINGKVYIGQTTTKPEKRERDHFYELRNNNHRNSHLQNSFNFHGESNFKFSVICWFNSKDELNRAEIHYMDSYDAINRNKGYNIREGGDNGKHSKETRRKLSIAHQGKTITPESKRKMSIAKQNMSLETKRKISIAKKGKKMSIEARRKISANNAKPKLGKGLFGFIGAYLQKDRNFEKKCWQSIIRANGKRKSLGVFHDPVSANIVYKLVQNEIF